MHLLIRQMYGKICNFTINRDHSNKKQSCTLTDNLVDIFNPYNSVQLQSFPYTCLFTYFGNNGTYS